MEPDTIMPTLFTSIYHLSLDTRNMVYLKKLSEEILTGPFSTFTIEGNSKFMCITLIEGCSLPNNANIPLDLRKLIEFATSQNVRKIVLSEIGDELPCLPLYDDDYVFTFRIYAKIEGLKIENDTTKSAVRTCYLELQHRVFADHRIMEKYRSACKKYAEDKLNFLCCTVSFITKEQAEKINDDNDLENAIEIAFSEETEGSTSCERPQICHHC
jgi:hypothetical protein